MILYYNFVCSLVKLETDYVWDRYQINFIIDALFLKFCQTFVSETKKFVSTMIFCSTIQHFFFFLLQLQKGLVVENKNHNCLYSSLH